MYVCLFDIDGTLVASGGAGKAALEAALTAEFGITHLIAKLELSGRTDRAICRDLFRAYDVPDTEENWQRLMAAYLEHLPAFLASHRGYVLPGIVQLLGTLQKRGDVALGLLTGNVRAGARAKLSHFGLDHHFRFGGFGDRHLCRDDVAREALAEVHRHLNGSVQLDRVWVIGDTPLDIRCARAIGARVLAVATGWHPPEELATSSPDLVLRDLGDHEPFLQSLPRQ